MELFANYSVLSSLVLTKKITVGKAGPCRYCGKKSPDVEFKKVAHAIPELIGNDELFSFDECDECNKYFDKNLENSLANFLGISRTVSKVHGKKGVPKFKSQDGERIEIIGGNLVIIENHDSTMIDVKEDMLSINIDKSSYIPIQVYKCFVKMALAILPDTELPNYKQCINWIRNEVNPRNFTPAAIKIRQYFVSGVNPFPAIWITLFKRLGDKKRYPNFICSIAFKNSIFQFTVPFGEDDRLVDYSRISFPKFPLLTNLLPGAKGDTTCEELDLTGTEKIKAKDTAFMKLGESEVELTLEDIPDEILQRIEKLGLKFDERLLKKNPSVENLSQSESKKDESL